MKLLSLVYLSMTSKISSPSEWCTIFRTTILIFMVNFVLGIETRTLQIGSRRNERYLVYPTPNPGAPTKVQLIMGLGLPMEVDVSTIVGYVMKFNYALPYNASYLTQPYVVSRNERSIDRGLFNEEESARSDNGNEEENNGVALATRWEIYRVIESALDGFGVSGKGCLLRTVCHLAEVPFDEPRSGLFGELVHLLLTPSATREKWETAGDQEYHSAESAGRDNPGKCVNLFPECDGNFLEYFTEINAMGEEIESQPGYYH